MSIEFYLRLETLPPMPLVWGCRVLRRGLREQKWKTLLVEATPIVLDSPPSDTLKENAEVENVVWELAARHVGCDIFQIQRWPLCVHVADETQPDSPFTSRWWGELYPTLHSAQEESFQCVERRHHLPWEVVEGAGLLSWRALWHGFSRGYVELNVVERFAAQCLSAASASEKRHFLPLLTPGNLAGQIQAFHASAEAEDDGMVPEAELECRWAACAKSHSPE